MGVVGVRTLGVNDLGSSARLTTMKIEGRSHKWRWFQWRRVSAAAFGTNHATSTADLKRRRRKGDGSRLGQGSLRAGETVA